MLGISHTKNTMVGSAYVRGVSGGERKVRFLPSCPLGYEFRELTFLFPPACIYRRDGSFFPLFLAAAFEPH